MIRKAILLILPLIFLGSLQTSASFYKEEHALFSMRPNPGSEVTNLTRFGPVGLSIDLIQPTFTIRISGVQAGSPAAATGELEPGMIIKSVNGEELADIDPRIQMGNWITEAEATDGRLVMQVANEVGGPTREVVVELPVLGRYSDTWPLDCPKSDNIVRNFAEALKAGKTHQGFAAIGMLFLLSTGDESDLEHVAEWARAHPGNWTYPWHIGYGGLALCEYYLRTGDEEVLPTIQRLADRLVEMENFGGWVGRGPIANLNYGGGGGHLNAAAVPAATFLLLAKEAGATVPEDTLLRVLERYYRYSGRGNVPYGMGFPENGYTDNGKNGKLAFTMAAAAALDPRGEDTVYARARDASAQFSFYSTSYMLHGHTGGGIGEIWRSAAMGLLHDVLPKHYREFMDNRRWHYEMSRNYDGSFSILGGARYDNTEWGAGYALTYTVPRRTLRLTGAPPTEFSNHFQLPDIPWGTAADKDFQLITPASCADGDAYDLSHETLATHAAKGIARHLRNNRDDAETIRRYIRHPDMEIRRVTARALPRHGSEMLMSLLHCDDARVRHAAIEGLKRNVGRLMTDEVYAHLLAMIHDPEESLFVKNSAIQALGQAGTDRLVEQVDLLLSFFDHDEWWLRYSALVAAARIATDERVYEKVLPAIGEVIRTNHRYRFTGVTRWGTLPNSIRNAPPEVQELARKSLEDAFVNYAEIEHDLNRVVNTVNRMTREAIADSLVKVPGGYDALYQIGRQQFPDEDLPFREVFLQANPNNFSPELREIVDQAVGGNLIPQYLAEHRGTLLQEAASQEVRGGRMEGLVELYRRVGIDDYNWMAYGPEHDEMEWYYFSFDPPEPWMRDDDRLGRYRDVTIPTEAKDWNAADFDAQAAGWQRGLAPFAASNGDLEKPAGSGGCSLPFCQCSDPVNTLWEEDVLLLHGTFDFPTFEEGYRYRLLHGGISHVGSGGGYRIYVNGKLFHEDTTAVDRRAGGRPEGRIIPKEWWPEFEDGQATISVITFKKHHPRTNRYGGNISIFMQRMEVPPLDE